MKLALYQIHMDWNENGVADENESITSLTSFYLGQRPSKEMIAETVVDFDYADVYWLRAYSNVMLGMIDTGLAFDHSELWNVIAHRLFERGQVEFEFLMEEEYDANQGFLGPDLIDWIAAIHNLRFTLEDPERLKKAHSHFLKAISHSRVMWAAIQDETDNQNEFLPNPNQTSAVTRARITKEMVPTWFKFLDEGEAIMQGEKLIPFWRAEEGKRGVNIYRVFHEPRDFDFVLWFHGSAAAPYLEEDKPITDQATWRGFNNVFGGDFFGFSIWIN